MLHVISTTFPNLNSPNAKKNSYYFNELENMNHKAQSVSTQQHVVGDFLFLFPLTIGRPKILRDLSF